MLASSIATVIGPTPPGTGVMQRRARARRELDVADELAVSDAVDADVDHDGAGLDPLAADQPGLADRRDHDVGAADLGGEVARARMTDRHGRVPLEQQQRDRLADQEAPPDDDGARAAQLARRSRRADA